MSQTLDLADGVTSFSAAEMPVILRTTNDDPTIAGQIVSLQISAFGGVKLASQSGVLGLLATLMGRGTYSYSKEEIDEIFTRTGARFSIEPGRDALQVNLVCLKKFLPKLLPVVSEMLRVPLFQESEINLAKDQMRNQLKSEKETPDAVLSLEISKLFFKDHPYSVRPEGFLETVDKLSKDQLSTTLFRAFNKSNLLFVFVGPVSREETSALIEKFFSSIPAGTRTEDVNEKIENVQSNVHFVKFEAPTTYFAARFKAPALENPDYPALAIGMQILDNRLFEEVRTKRALTYSVSASIGNSRVNSGQLYVSSTQLQEAVEVIFEEVKKLQIEELSKENIELQVRKFLSSWYLGRETRSSQASIFSLYEIFGIGWERSGSFIERLNQVKPEDIRRVMQTYLKDFTLVVVGPEEVNLTPALSKYGFALKE